MPLLNLQTELAELLLNEEISKTAMPPMPHLIIYRNNMINHLVNALQGAYPLIERIVGPGFFRTMAMEYIKQYPCRHSNLHDYGEYIGNFLAEYAPAKHLIYLPEVAEFEWASHLLYFAPDHAPFDTGTLKSFSSHQYDQLHFILHPASFLKQFRFPILRIVDLCDGKIDTEVDIRENGIDLLMIRRHLEISLMPLPPADFTFLTALSNNKSLSESLQAAITIDPCFNLTTKLSEWITDRTIVDCFIYRAC